ncbi:hypothetical protein JN11_02469 [Mucilaginibacter frigoritolerans]|jgi:hypothetical protein|uniref:Uncharacterized protein n=1 Tax=Mucilaginibacter frigoritolerans TaxID=652788 RepID=A0A562U2T8_9SPHI|nr:hypothetical protein [Mucilaginibacter frigoritolerans]TWJ00054.1 hypothetical protein JN11_02469 [Mucilaginibacter frigoritolerans]
MSKKIKYHYDNKLHAKFIRDNGQQKTNHGYVVGYSTDFVLLQETRWFKLTGFHIFPVSMLKKIHFSNWNRRYHKIMIWRGLVETVGINYPIDLTNWESIFESLKKYSLNVTVEFNKGVSLYSSIVKILPQSVYIQPIESEKSITKEVTEIDFENISNIHFSTKIIHKKSRQPAKRKVKMR